MHASRRMLYDSMRAYIFYMHAHMNIYMRLYAFTYVYTYICIRYMFACMYTFFYVLNRGDFMPFCRIICLLVASSTIPYAASSDLYRQNSFLAGFILCSHHMTVGLPSQPGP